MKIGELEKIWRTPFMFRGCYSEFPEVQLPFLRLIGRSYGNGAADQG